MNNPPVKMCRACWALMFSALKTCPCCGEPARIRDQQPVESKSMDSARPRS